MKGVLSLCMDRISFFLQPHPTRMLEEVKKRNRNIENEEDLYDDEKMKLSSDSKQYEEEGLYLSLPPNTRSMTQRSIIVGIWEEEGRERAEA